MATATRFEPVLNATPATEYSSVLEVRWMRCRSRCRSACFDYCIYGQPYCLKAIGPEQVIQGISAPTKEIWGAMPRAVKKSVEVAAS